MSFQHRVKEWMTACFGPVISSDKQERNNRFLEESLELVQAGGMRKEDAHALVEYTFNRPVGELADEVGGVMTTLAALCLAHGENMDECAATAIEKNFLRIDKIREKQKNKPKFGPLAE